MKLRPAFVGGKPLGEPDHFWRNRVGIPLSLRQLKPEPGLRPF
jgi:hypothetical protein